MNKFKVANIIVAVFAIALIVLAFASARPNTTEEPKTIAETRIIEATVEGVSTDGTNVLFRGSDGNLWSADSDTKMYRGQQVTIELSTNGTEQIEDDEILNIWLT